MVTTTRRLPLHPLAVRAAHWVNALAMTWMVMSGWAIYNASPLFGFKFPAWATVGGWLGGSIAWHFAAMWLLALNGLVYVAYGLVSGHFRRHFLPVTPRAVAQDLWLALKLRLPHRPGAYNAVQRASYLGVLGLSVLVVASGLSIWKPVQFEGLVDLFGGFDVARRVHFFAMAGIVAFVALHLALVLIVPKTLWPMFSGRAAVNEGRS